jgi:hypothetical protein
MKQNGKEWRWLRAAGVLLFGLIILAALLPSTYGRIEGPPPNPKMWRCGPYLFLPDRFFGEIGIVTLFVGCTVFGIARRNSFEAVGWCVLGLLFFAMMVS